MDILTLSIDELYSSTSVSQTKHRNKRGRKTNKEFITVWKQEQVDEAFDGYVELLFSGTAANEYLSSSTEQPKVGADLYGAWSDLTDEELDFLKRLHEENNRMFLGELANLMSE